MIRFFEAEKSYSVAGKTVSALRPCSLEIADGQVFGIIGHSGAGKSTLLRLINLLERPSHGRIEIDGIDLASMNAATLRMQRRRIGMIFQHFNLLSSQTVTDNVAFPLRLAGELNAASIRERVASLLERVGMTSHAGKYPSQLSGGQKQRVGIARALANQPSILLCDEATSALDPQTTVSILELLAQINVEMNLTIVLITHEMDVVRRVCDRVAVLESGIVVEEGWVADVFLNPQHPTTRDFVQHALPDAGAPAYAKIAGQIVRLSFQGETTWLPLLGRITRETDVDFNIIAGRIDRIKTMPYGQLTVALDGERVADTLQALRQAGIVVDDLSRPEARP